MATFSILFMLPHSLTFKNFMKNLSALFLIFLIISCNSSKKEYLPTIFEPTAKENFTETELRNWAYMDYQTDTIPGISLEKAYKESLIDSTVETSIIVATIDTAIDIDHEDLKGRFWINENELDNNIDDDKNGYVDDFNGWNFLGNQSGDFPLYENYEFVRVVRFYQSKYDSVNPEQLSEKEQERYRYFSQAKETLNEELVFVKETIENGKTLISDYYQGLKKVKQYIPEAQITEEILDSLLGSHPNFKKEIESVKILFEYDMEITDLENDLAFYERLRDVYYNLEFDEREKIGDDVDNIKDYIYGSNIVNGRINDLDHGTLVAGLIVAQRNNNIGIDGVSDNAIILPIDAAVNGQAHDKDVALAIKYAVDKGAKIINITTMKEFSLHKEWVFDAIRYAASKDVLIVNAAGNDNVDLDEVKNYYPNDNDYVFPEIADNFLTVGGSSYNISNNLKLGASNYGKETVDLFAPGEHIYTTASNNEYEFVDGTSFAAPIVAGIAALIRSKYPSLTAPEVKNILMESGTSYNVLVNIAEEDEDPNMVSFSSLSKSGKIANAYNALLLANQIANSK